MHTFLPGSRSHVKSVVIGHGPTNTAKAVGFEAQGGSSNGTMKSGI